MAVVLALGAAMSWSVADFLGGATSREADEVHVAWLSQVAGLALVLVAAPMLGGVLSGEALWWGALAGVGGATGLVAYFRALAIGPMGVTAPLAALVGAGVPVSAGLLAGERPGALAVAGMLVGLSAVVLVSRPGRGATAAEAAPPRGAAPVTVGVDPARVRRGLLWAAVAGLGFGWFFVGLDRTPDTSGLWPLLGARFGGITVLTAMALRRRTAAPPRRATAIALGSGLIDMAANTLFLFAVREGMLVLVSVLTSLYPVGVVLLARATLGERLARHQTVGIGLALAATALIAA